MQPKFIKTASKKESPETIRGKNQVQSANLPSFAMFDKKTFAKMAKIVPKPCISNPKKDQKQNLKINIVPSFLKESKNITFTPPLKSHPTIINMLNRIRVLIKAANLFRFRTHFRTLKFINETQLSLIDDRTYFPEKKPREFYLKRFTEKNVNFFFFSFFNFY